MKKILFMFLMVTLSSCIINDKLLTSSGGTKPLGVPKQPDVVGVLETNSSTTSPSVNQPKECDHATTPVEETKDSSFSFNWYYLILVGVLGIIAFLVYRLKKQSMIRVD